MKIINVVISPQGETKIETMGFAGAECREASRAIAKALGQAAAEELTAEFYQAVAQERPNRQQT